MTFGHVDAVIGGAQPDLLRDVLEKLRASEEGLQRSQTLVRMTGRLSRMGAWSVELAARHGDLFGRGERYPRQGAGPRSHCRRGHFRCQDGGYAHVVNRVTSSAMLRVRPSA